MRARYLVFIVGLVILQVHGVYSCEEFKDAYNTKINTLLANGQNSNFAALTSGQTAYTLAPGAAIPSVLCPAGTEAAAAAAAATAPQLLALQKCTSKLQSEDLAMYLSFWHFMLDDKKLDELIFMKSPVCIAQKAAVDAEVGRLKALVDALSTDSEKERFVKVDKVQAYASAITVQKPYTGTPAPTSPASHTHSTDSSIMALLSLTVLSFICAQW